MFDSCRVADRTVMIASERGDGKFKAVPVLGPALNSSSHHLEPDSATSHTGSQSPYAPLTEEDLAV